MTTKTTAKDRIFTALQAAYEDGNAEVRRYSSAITGQFGWHASWNDWYGGSVLFLGRTETDAIAFLSDGESKEISAYDQRMLNYYRDEARKWRAWAKSSSSHARTLAGLKSDQAQQQARSESEVAQQREADYLAMCAQLGVQPETLDLPDTWDCNDE